MTDERYGAQRIKRGLTHFLTGKGISSIAGFLAVILLVRLLPIESFAAYSVLTAFVELITAVSGFGMAHLMVRYVPELYAKHYQVALRSLIVRSTVIRTFILFAVVGLGLAVAGPMAPAIGLGSQIDAFKVFLIVVILRCSTHFLSQILESTLHQGITQFAFSATALVRLVGMAILTYQGNADLETVIWVEAIADLISLLIVSYGIIKVIILSKAVKAAPSDDRNWISKNTRSLFAFAAQGYLQHLAILPYGGHTNRLVGGHMLATGALANYGFSQTLYEYVKRYLPAQLLVGLIRPVVVSRYVARNDFSVAARLCGYVLQINILIMGLGFALLLVSGSDLLSFISNGKYGTDAKWLLLALMVVLLLETQRQQLELLVQTIGKYQILIPSNILLSSSVLLAIATVPAFGAIAFPVANIFGLLLSNEWVRRRMLKEAGDFRLDWFEASITLTITLIAVLTGLLLQKFGGHWIGSMFSTASCYVILSYLTRKKMVMNFVRDITSKHNTQLPFFVKRESTTRLKIAFGILSSKKSAAAIEAIAAQVAPHPVYVHHDFSKQPEFSPAGENITVLSSPVPTAWGDWSLVEASFRLMSEALRDPAVTHFQLLSESCLVVRPMSEFENYLRSKQPDFMVDVLNMSQPEAYNSHGWRYFSTDKILPRVHKRLSLWIFQSNSSYTATHSVNIRSSGTEGGIGIRAIFCRAFMKMSWIVFKKKLRALNLETMAIGGQWFGASRSGAEWLIDAKNQCKDLTEHFQHCHIPDEAYIHTLVINGQMQNQSMEVAPTNHFMSWKSCGTGPDTLAAEDVDEITSSTKFFARKVPLESDTEIRMIFARNPTEK